MLKISLRLLFAFMAAIAICHINAQTGRGSELNALKRVRSNRSIQNVNTTSGLPEISGRITSLPSLRSVKCLGGSGDEGGFSNFMTQTSDGGFITCSYSGSVDGNIMGNHGGLDVWVIKFSANGTIQWEKNYGGTGDDFGNRVIQTSDGGYVILGYTYSNDGDVSGNHGQGDLWIVKLDSAGNIIWQKCYGGSGDEFAYYGIIQTLDGGYAAICSSASNNGDANGNHGGYDVLVLKLNGTGKVQWSKTYGGSQDEYGNLIVQNSDGSFTISADTYSNNGNISGNHGAIDTWVARLTSNGSIIWKKCLGGSAEEFNASLISTRDGNVLIGDYAGSHDGDVVGNHGVIPNGGDMWLVKLNLSNGAIIWTKTLGGNNGGPRPSLPDYPDDEVALFIYETATGDFLVAGGATSSNGDLTINRGVGDCWILRLDNTGNIIWQKSFGGSDEDAATAIFPLAGGGYLVTGWTYSNDYDFKNAGQHGQGDIFIAMISGDIAVPTKTYPQKEEIKSMNSVFQYLNNYPNPFSLNTGISFFVSKPGPVTVRILDVAGRVVKTLAVGKFEIGNYHFQWNGDNDSGVQQRSGLYFLKLAGESHSEVRKLLLTR